MAPHFVSRTKAGFTVKLWRGERTCLLGFDVDNPEPDFVGFAIECKQPGADTFSSVRNRMAFSYPGPAIAAVTGSRKFNSLAAPFQCYRWVHFPFEPAPGTYTYRVTKMHMPVDAPPVKGTSITLKIELDAVTYPGFLDVGFTRGFASSQAFLDKVPAGQTASAFGSSLIPNDADDGPDFAKPATDVYRWMGFEAYDLLFRFLDDAIADPTVTVDFFAYDLNEPELVARLAKLGPRLRAIVDDSSKKKKGVISGHGATESAESRCVATLQAAGAAVTRTHFTGLQHNKVLVASRNGEPYAALAGSMNFSFRGIYIQSNNVIVFTDPDIARLYSDVFEQSFTDPAKFKKSDLATKWHLVQSGSHPPIQFAFSPHTSTDVALNPVRGAIEQATSSVFYCVAFLNQLTSGPTYDAFTRLMSRPIFSYGISDKRGTLDLKKPNGDVGLVDFAYLADHAPEPFKTEWSGQAGINLHHKFVVTDFNLPTAKVFTGSSNLSPTGEAGNGDNLIMIEDQRIATSYAIAAVLVFDHLHFRNNMEDAAKKKSAKAKDDALKLRKPKAISKAKDSWFDKYYVAGSLREADRTLFSS